MPYITKERRADLHICINNMVEQLKKMGNSKGDLNYTITMLVKAHTDTVGLKYDTLADVVGVLEGVKDEYVRCVVNRYEDTKIDSNGGIY